MFSWQRRGDGEVLSTPFEIKSWVESHGGRPSRLAGTSVGNDAGLIRIWFPGQKVGRLEPITWEQFFSKMEEKELALRCWSDEQGTKPFARIVAKTAAHSYAEVPASRNASNGHFESPRASQTPALRR